MPANKIVGGWVWLFMISFVVPAHNEEVLLGRTLDAIRGEAERVGEAFEIVVADDSSTDATAEIAREHGARVIRVEYRQIAATRNAGARAANGAALLIVLVLVTSPLWGLPVPESWTRGPLGTVRYSIQIFMCHFGLVLLPCAYLLLKATLKQTRWIERLKLGALGAICLWLGLNNAREVYWFWGSFGGESLFVWFVFVLRIVELGFSVPIRVVDAAVDIGRLRIDVPDADFFLECIQKL